VDAYRKLREQNPSEGSRYDRRIAELTELARMQHAEEKE
jgi:hypothetical protein